MARIRKEGGDSHFGRSTDNRTQILHFGRYLEDYDCDLPRGDATFKVFKIILVRILPGHIKESFRGKCAVAEMWQTLNNSQALSGRMRIEIAYTRRASLV